ncbi:helix-turn-helix transcriptional regulator [Nocardia vermiculata]|uniref:YafY family transcriptional regulator n=1 Tax=Nocardia vermiculata TaxID=257274 RepID=A0A846XVH1_9NOCA|nr:YafY family protein [Nocardia vermiculata]NKY51123.1 YafY family transcriptional regulator [Nocardia vermiculata]
MSRPAGRVLALLELLQSGGLRTVAELAERLGVDERTVRRYVDHLIDLDIPVESVRGRYGGYRLASGYRLPPLMFTDDEAVAVVLGLLAGSGLGLAPADATAAETAAAKIRRVLPARVADRLDALVHTLDFPTAAGDSTTPDAGILLTLADAVRYRRPVVLRYTDRHGRHSERTVHPEGIVAHAGQWYVTGNDPGRGEDRTFRLDRIADARTGPGSFPASTTPVSADHMVANFAAAEYRYRVTVRVFATVARIRSRLPATVAILDAPDAVADPGVECWRRVEIRAEQLDWLPPVLAALDRPFVVDGPEELREQVLAFADRLTASAVRRTARAAE